jgi:arylsulfatase A-like enzyme
MAWDDRSDQRGDHRPASRCRPAAACLAACLLLTACPAVGVAETERGGRRPDIVVILADDMGYSDIGCYGGEIVTPALDALAANGVRFTQFYNTGRCCPTRASLLTGLYPHQAGIGHMMDDRGFDGYRGELRHDCLTIPEALAPAGYRSYAVGKWHVTRATAATDRVEQHNWPRQRGFDRFYGTITGAGSFYDPAALARDNRLISPWTDPEYPAANYFYTDAISDHAVRFIREHAADTPDRPLFLYVAFTAAHWPMHAPEDDIARCRGRYAAGYAAVREARYARMLQAGVIDAASTTLWPLPAGLGERGADWTWDERNMEVYAAMVERMDRGIGRIVATLRETGRLDDTLMLYLQDNGGCAEGIGRRGEGPPRPANPTAPPQGPDFLQRDIIPKQTRDGYPVRQGKGVLAGPADTYIAYGEAWSTVSNTPFRKHKHWVHEGGISTPLIAHWPSGIRDPGRLDHTPGHLIDIMTTAVDLAGARIPADMTPLEGRSLAPLFAGGVLEREAIYWEHEGNRAVRMGSWKLVAEHDGAWELYDIDADRSEQRDVAAMHPERVRDLAGRWDAWASRARVEPWETVRPRPSPAAPRQPVSPPRPAPVKAAIAPPSTAFRSPNVILVMADDFGYECVGANGGASYRTPTLDALATSGVRFTRCHVQPLCTPTRLELMTGLSNVRNYVDFGHLPADAVTFAHHFRRAGYATGICGKWQLGTDPDLPRHAGFDESCLWQHTRRPPRYANPGLEINGTAHDFGAGAYGPRLVNEFALDFITRHRDRPFLLYYPMILTHDPFQPTPESPDWDPAAIGENVHRDPAHFADMTAYLDAMLGRLVMRLDDLGIRDNTLLVFLGDNGTHPTITSRCAGRDVRGGKGLTNQRGTHVPCIVSWPAELHEGRICDDLVTAVDFMPTLCAAARIAAPIGDGISFLPQLRGDPGTPRSWIYSWYRPRLNRAATASEGIFDGRFKLYRDGRLFDVAADPDEKHPLPAPPTDADSPAVNRLRSALDGYAGARPPALDALQPAPTPKSAAAGRRRER